MAKNTIADLDTTPANNTDVIGQSTAGTANANTLDTIVQNMLGLLARFYNDLGGVVTVGGTANAITLTSTSTYQSLESGLLVGFKNTSGPNTGATTVNLDSLGAKAIRKGNDEALVGGELADNGFYTLRYDTALDSGSGGWALGVNSTPYPSGHLWGLTLSNNGSDATNDIDIAVGTARDGADTANMDLASALTKQLDAAWAVGTNAGGLDTGSIANTTYHVWLIKRPDTGVVDVLFSTSATAPTMPTNYTLKRRIGSIMRESGVIVGFVQNGDLFTRKVPINSINATNPGTSAVTRLANAPLGIKTELILGVYVTFDRTSNTDCYCLITDLDGTDTAPTSSVHSVGLESNIAGTDIRGTGAICRAVSDTNAQFRSRVSTSSTNSLIRISTLGWVDRRGQ